MKQVYILSFKNITLLKSITLLLVLLFAGPLGGAAAQPDGRNRYSRPLNDVLRQMEQQFGVEIECRRFAPDTVVLVYADSRLRPYSLEESLDNVTLPIDMKWSKRGERKYRVEPYEYYRRTPADGRKLLAWLSAKYSDRKSWELRRGELLLKARARLDMQPLYDSLKADPMVLLGETRTFDGYTTQCYALETLPGIFVCGTIYSPEKCRGRHPLIVSPAGHWPEGRLRADQQYRMATFARMGAVAVDLDIVGWGNAARTVPFQHEDFRSMRLQMLWSKAVTDWIVASRRDIDTARMAATGGSGGATHTLLLALQDSRFRVLAAVVHIVAHFDGGCPCESAVPLSTIAGGSCTPELLAAVAAPRPLLVVSDGGDWTASWPDSEYPFMRRIWSFYGADENVRNVHLPDERHDYGPNKRRAVYEFFARELGLDLDRANEERVTLQQPAALEIFRPDGQMVDGAEVQTYNIKR